MQTKHSFDKKYLADENPVLMVFKGFVNGKEATLLQHINQLNFLLTSVDKAPEKPKIKIGFDYPNE